VVGPALAVLTHPGIVGQVLDCGPSFVFNTLIGEWYKYPQNIPRQADLPSSRTDQIFTKANDPRTEAYITGRFG
jgi:hypothetical protein